MDFFFHFCGQGEITVDDNVSLRRATPSSNTEDSQWFVEKGEVITLDQQHDVFLSKLGLGLSHGHDIVGSQKQIFKLDDVVVGESTAIFV